MIFDMFLVLAITFCFAEASGLFKDNGGAYIYAKKGFRKFLWLRGGLPFLDDPDYCLCHHECGIRHRAGRRISIIRDPSDEGYHRLPSYWFCWPLSICLGWNCTKLCRTLPPLQKSYPLSYLLAWVFFIYSPPTLNLFFQEEPIPPEPFGAAAVMLFFAFTGFESIAIAAAEMENPQKNLPKATLVTIFIVSAIYLLLLTCAIGIMGYGLADTKAPVQEAFGRIAGTFGTTIVAAGTLVSIGGLCIGSSFITPHSCLALAQKQMMPAFMARENRFGAPHWCIIISTLIAMLIAYTGSFTFLASISVVSRFSQYIPTCLAILVFRKTMADTPRAFRIPFGPVIPVIAVLVSLWLLSQATFQQIAMGLGAAVIASSFLTGLSVKIRQKNNGMQHLTIKIQKTCSLPEIPLLSLQTAGFFLSYKRQIPMTGPVLPLRRSFPDHGPSAGLFPAAGPQSSDSLRSWLRSDPTQKP